MRFAIAVRSETADRLLRKVRERVTDLRPVFRGPVDREATRLFQQQFQTRGRFGGQMWPELRRSTLRDKARVNRAGMGVLRRSNRLWASLTKSGGPDSVRTIEKDRYERGTSVPYAQYHQEGAILRQWGGQAFSRPRRLPKRMLVPDPFPARVSGRIERHIADFIEDGT